MVLDFSTAQDINLGLYILTQNGNVTNDLVRGESRSTCSFIETKRWSDRQISSSGIEGNVDKAES